MTINLTEAQFALLSKRNEAKTKAESIYREATSMQAAAKFNLETLIAAMNDVIVQIATDNSVELPQSLQSVSIKQVKNGYQLEVQENTAV